jgi:alcohol dehydrogenase class IV
MERSNWTYYPVEKVQIGYDAASSVCRAAEQHHRRRVFVLTSRSVAGTSTVESIVRGLGPAHVGTFAGMRAHVPLDDVFAATDAAGVAGADLLVAVGGGSVMDAAKLVALCLRYDLRDSTGLGEYAGFGAARTGAMHPPGIDGWTRIVAVPTTLSAAEFTWWSGGLDTATRKKRPYSHPHMMPRHVALDPAATLDTPRELFLSSGMKAVDHAVERLATLRTDVLTEVHCARSLELLWQGLTSVSADPDDLDARLRCQTGMALAMASPASGAKVGASHALGHALGAHNGVPHGLTSCVLLPAVLRWTEKHQP